MRRGAFVAGTFVFVAMTRAFPYDVETHVDLTNRAYDGSVLGGTANFIKDLGLYGRTGSLTLPKKYWDMGQLEEIARAVDDHSVDPTLYERDVIEQMRQGPALDQPRGWMLRGAIREDDIGEVPNTDPLFFRLFVRNPLDDPYFPRQARPINHFFDPAKSGLGLQGFGRVDNVEPKPASDWMIGVAGAFGAATADSSRRNHFSALDAREAEWRVITGTKRDGTPVAQQERLAYVATMFRSLGDMLHIIQDMAQPQHTRNDSHVTGSAYEGRVKQRSLGRPLKRVGLAPISLPALNYGAACGSEGGFCPVVLSRYADYFSTSINAVAAGRGMADYSNRGFFSEGTNLGNNTYTLPSNNIADYSQVSSTDDAGNLITLLVGTVADNVFATETGVKLTGLSAWDESMSEIGAPRKASLYSQNYDDYARVLIPRAIAYSAGLLNYFFRGKIDVRLPSEQVFAVADFSKNIGFTSLKVSVKNATMGIVAANDQRTGTPGKLYAVVSYRTNSCWTGTTGFPTLSAMPHLDDTNQRVWNSSCRSPSLESQPLPDVIISNAVGVPAAFDTDYSDVTFTLPTPLPFNALDVDMRIVYRGPLGAEDDAIAIGWYRYISEPNFLDIQNNNDCSNTCPDAKNPKCDPATTSVKLPFFNGQSTARDVATVSDLLPGQYARVAFLTQEGYHLTDLNTGQVIEEVGTNQDYPFQTTIDYPDAPTSIRPAGETITNYYIRTRNVNGGGAIYSWSYMFGSYFAPDTCPALASGVPREMTIMFP